MIINLDVDEVSFVKEKATRRRELKLRTGARNFRSDPRRDDIRIMELGIAANLAVSKFLNIDADFTDYRGAGKDHDMVYNGRTIKTKFTNYTDLSITSIDRFTSDIIVLCSGSLPNIEIKGWTDRRSFTTHYQVKNWGYGDRCVLDPAWLKDIAELKYGTPEATKETAQANLFEF